MKSSGSLRKVKELFLDFNMQCCITTKYCTIFTNHPNFYEEIEEKYFKNNQEVPFIGVIRNGTGAEFTWLTGTILETTSFMWSPGEPNDPDFEVLCGS
ncbi:hypothetical protein Avbf_11581 [Armadillidium vulgare]|nr:hypothetical protein Avbf_11581 [Armadillidium vulgare]